jgi:hypothetical protein
LYVYPVPMTSSTAGQAFHVGILPPPSGASAGFPVTGSWTNHSALRYQSGIVLIIGPGLDGLSSFSQGLVDTNLIFLVSTSGVALYFIRLDSEWIISRLQFVLPGIVRPTDRAGSQPSC